MNFNFASTGFPRTGFDQRNSNNTFLIGPRKGVIYKKFFIDSDFGIKCKGGVVDQFGDVWFSGNDKIYNFNFDKFLLKLKLTGKINSGLMALDSGDLICQIDDSLKLFNRCEIKNQFDVGQFFEGKSFSPNLSYEKKLILIINDEVCQWDGNLKPWGLNGYDLTAPIFLVDGTAVTSVYGGIGLCCHRGPDIIWKTSFECDFPPVSNKFGDFSCSSLNENETRVYSIDKKLLFKFNEVASSSCNENFWFFLTRNKIFCTDRNGKIIWDYSVCSDLMWGLNQPLIDGENKVYLSSTSHLFCFDEIGKKIFSPIELSEGFSGIILHSQGLFCLRNQNFYLIN